MITTLTPAPATADAVFVFRSAVTGEVVSRLAQPDNTAATLRGVIAAYDGLVEVYCPTCGDEARFCPDLAPMLRG